MNKKIFTLLASLLMLFLTASVVNAQVQWFYGADVVNLPEGQAKGAYHLKVAAFGAGGTVMPPAGWAPGANVLLALDKDGHLKFMNDAEIWRSYQDLREALWCITVKKPERLGQQPAYNFINKAYSTLFAVDSGNWIGTDFSPTAFTGTPLNPHTMQAQVRGSLEKLFIGEQFANWAFSRSYNTTPLEKAQPLRIELPDEPDYFMTIAYDNDATAWPTFTPWIPKLVKVHAKDLEKTSDFYQNHIVLFTITEAAPRVLTEDDFNTTLWTKEKGEFGRLIFDPDVKGEDIVNVLAQDLTAFASANNNVVIGAHNENYYLSFRTLEDEDEGKEATWVYVADSANIDNYYNDKNDLFPIIKDDGESDEDDDEIPAAYGTLKGSVQYDFRLVYFPSQDSVVVNVRGFQHIKDSYGNYPSIPADEGWALDMESYTSSDGLFNWEIRNYLIVHLQDLTKSLDERVLTISDHSKITTNTRIHFDINDCKLSDNRTTVPRNLYLIRDQLGRYLVMPLELGDYTPQWIEPRNNEDPMKTPSYHWLVYPNNEGADISSVNLTNREFDWIQIEFSNIYKTPEYFNGRWNELLHRSVPVEFYNVFGLYPSNPPYPVASLIGEVASGAKIYYSSAETADPYMNGTKGLKWNVAEGWHGSFLKVQDDQAAAAKVAAKLPLTQEERQKLYRTNEYLGYKYIDEDALNYFTYSFNHLHAYADDRYLGPLPNQTKDTLIYGVQDQNHFELKLPDSKIHPYKGEKYGIGWGDYLLDHPATKDIAKLERYFYHLKENNYWDFTNNNKYLVLSDENRRYVLIDELIATSRPLEKSAFYLRFTYQPEGKPEYYTLLERVRKSTALRMEDLMGFKIAQLLKVYDDSHGGSSGTTPLANDTIGIVALSIDDNTAYARAYPKVLRDMVSSFAVSNAFEPLYRRFNEGVYIPSGIDAGVDDGGERAIDDPRLVKIYRAFNEPKVDYLYEDAMSVNAREFYRWENPSKGINYLSLENIYDHEDWMDQNVGHWPHNFAFYLDTAYVNRGTGHIKPQYMIMVGPQFINEKGCFVCGEQIPLRKGLYGRYLINATDSARYGGHLLSTNWGGVRDDDYIWDVNWERLVFVPAIHIGDSLYILRCGLNYETLHTYGSGNIFRLDEYGVEYLHLATLIAEAKKPGSCIDIKRLDNNLHKDWVFSMRFYERYDYEHFLLESETTNRVTSGPNAGRMIAPMQGGWVKWQNHEMVISRGSYQDVIRDGEKWNTEPTTDDPVANDALTGNAVKVIAGDGIVTILNAAGKKVTISNVLGQTVAGSVLTSDNAAIAAPKGILVVAVEGENAVKAVVK